MRKFMGGTSEEEGHRMGQGKHANMPTEVVMEEYPSNGYSYNMPELDDTMMRLEGDAKQESGKKRKNLDRGMY